MNINSKEIKPIFTIPVIVFLWATAISLPAQHLTADQQSFLETQVHTISSSEQYAGLNWEPTAKNIGEKRLVLLGEFNHGSKEIFLTRNDLIRFLHEKKGFNVILFESGIGELIMPEIKRQDYSPAQMTNCLTGVWRTKEFTELMTYIQSKGIKTGGFDVQRSGGSFRFVMADVAAKHQLDTALFANLEERYGRLHRLLSGRNVQFDSVASPTRALIADYQKLAAALATSQDGGMADLLSLRTLANRVQYLEYMLQFARDKNWNKRWAARDSAMASNVRWWCGTMFKNEKIIIIAHNYHIAKHNENEQVMGEMLLPYFGPDMYVTGIFAGTGSYADNSGKPVMLTPPDTLHPDIKHFILPRKGNVQYLHIPNPKISGSDWLFEPVTVNDTFIDLAGTNQMQLFKPFDGLILIDKVSPPEK